MIRNILLAVYILVSTQLPSYAQVNLRREDLCPDYTEIDPLLECLTVDSYAELAVMIENAPSKSEITLCPFFIRKVTSVQPITVKTGVRVRCARTTSDQFCTIIGLGYHLVIDTAEDTMWQGLSFRGSNDHAILVSGEIENAELATHTFCQTSFMENVRTKDTRGGALMLGKSAGTINVVGCFFQENFSKTFGAAIYSRASQLNIILSLFVKNKSSGYGPAVYTANGGGLMIESSSFMGNRGRDGHDIVFNPGNGTSTYEDGFRNEVNDGDCRGVYNLVKESCTIFVKSPPSPFPTSRPTAIPTARPTMIPTQKPTSTPSQKPTIKITSPPSPFPTSHPTETPTSRRTTMPTQVQTTTTPSQKPTIKITTPPSSFPTSHPTETPTSRRTTMPTQVQTTTTPSQKPTTKITTPPSPFPTSRPTETPTSSRTTMPPQVPTTTTPSQKPTTKITTPSSPFPTSRPTETSTSRPTTTPTQVPTTTAPSQKPTTKSITPEPTTIQSIIASKQPGEPVLVTVRPTVRLTPSPTVTTKPPTMMPTPKINATTESPDSTNESLAEIISNKCLFGTIPTGRNCVDVKSFEDFQVAIESGNNEVIFCGGFNFPKIGLEAVHISSNIDINCIDQCSFHGVGPFLNIGGVSKIRLKNLKFDNSRDSSAVIVSTITSAAQTTFCDTEFSRNQVSIENDDLGGAITIESRSGVVNVVNNTFTGNIASRGGAIHSNGLKLNIVGSKFVANNAYNSGNAIFVGDGKHLLVESSTFILNTEVSTRYTGREGSQTDSVAIAVQPTVLQSQFSRVGSHEGTYTDGGSNRVILSGNCIGFYLSGRGQCDNFK